MKDKVLFEDMSMIANKWTTGISSRELNAQRVTLKDLFDKTSGSQNPNDSKSDKILPYPISTCENDLMSLYEATTNLQQIFKNSLVYPLVNENEVTEKEVKVILKRLELVYKHIACIKNSLVKIAK